MLVRYTVPYWSKTSPMCMCCLFHHQQYGIGSESDLQLWTWSGYALNDSSGRHWPKYIMKNVNMVPINFDLNTEVKVINDMSHIISYADWNSLASLWTEKWYRTWHGQLSDNVCDNHTVTIVYMLLKGHVTFMETCWFHMTSTRCDMIHSYATI